MKQNKTTTQARVREDAVSEIKVQDNKQSSHRHNAGKPACML